MYQGQASFRLVARLSKRLAMSIDSRSALLRANTWRPEPSLFRVKKYRLPAAADLAP